MKKANQSELFLGPHPSHIDETKLSCLEGNRQIWTGWICSRRDIVDKDRANRGEDGHVLNSLLIYKPSLKSIISRRLSKAENVKQIHHFMYVSTVAYLRHKQVLIQTFISQMKNEKPRELNDLSKVSQVKSLAFLTTRPRIFLSPNSVPYVSLKIYILFTLFLIK